MDALKPPDSFHLQAAQGWLELGNHLEANEELEMITAVMRGRSEVLLVRCEVEFFAKKWDNVVTLADSLVQLVPDKPQPWIHRSFARHELKRTQEAYDGLMPALRMFPKVWTIPYNLSCYCAQLGRLDECEEFFKKAVALDEHSVKQKAVDDPDLIPLWQGRRGTFWKRHE